MDKTSMFPPLKQQSMSKVIKTFGGNADLFKDQFYNNAKSQCSLNLPLNININNKTTTTVTTHQMLNKLFDYH